MNNLSEVVITGMGVVSPIGIGVDHFWNSLVRRHGEIGLSGAYRLEDVRRAPGLPYPLVAEIKNFDTKRIQAWKNMRRNIKVMSRDAQIGFVAADYAREDARLDAAPVEPERQGILYGAMMTLVNLDELIDLFRASMDENRRFVMEILGNGFNTVYPLWMLKYLPNMTPCHIGIAYDLRGPSNTLVNGETAGIGALLEATRVIRRGQADLMYAGGTSSCVYPMAWKRFQVYGLSSHVENPAEAVRPFDARRDGVVFGEGAAACVLESRESAEKRGVKIHGKILGWGETSESAWNQPIGLQKQPENVALNPELFTGKSIENAIRRAVEHSGLKKEEIAFVVACGYGSLYGDKVEAQAIRNVLGDIPVTAIKGGTGHAMAGSGMMEVVAAMLALQNGQVPPVLNCDEIAAECPIRVVTGQPISTEGKKAAVVVNYNFYGQASVVVLACE